jgi:hypothetical protein
MIRWIWRKKKSPDFTFDPVTIAKMADAIARAFTPERS